MREIFFRGKSLDTNEWVYGDLIHIDALYDLERHICACKIQDIKFMSHDVNPFTVGQYTGLRDKAGTRIFEGDIVKGENLIAAVEFNTDYNIGANTFEYDYYICGFHAKNEALTDLMLARQVEIIGNIHDNPELLRGEE